uniref:FIIND domain-containing protein n=1 Tax=Chelydra serpentina TaxID=8475 RepID=A0A8C3T0T3_CHESE
WGRAPCKERFPWVDRAEQGVSEPGVLRALGREWGLMSQSRGAGIEFYSQPWDKCEGTWGQLEKDGRWLQPVLLNPFFLTPCRVHVPGPGSFRCSETELGFEVRAAVTIQYGYDSWDQHLSASEKQQWMVAGPLFDIRVEPAGAVAAVHLPHFLCLAGGEVDASQMQIAHFVDGGMTLEEPTGVRPFHAVLQNPGFSLLGVLWRKIQSKCQAKVHSLALLYQALRAANTTLHLYLIPNDRGTPPSWVSEGEPCYFVSAKTKRSPVVP